MHVNHDIVQKILSSLLVFTSLMIVIELQSLYGSGLDLHRAFACVPI